MALGLRGIKSDWIAFQVVQESQWLGRAQHRLHWEICDSTGTSEMSSYKR